MHGLIVTPSFAWLNLILHAQKWKESQDATLKEMWKRACDLNVVCAGVGGVMVWVV